MTPPKGAVEQFPRGALELAKVIFERTQDVTSLQDWFETVTPLIAEAVKPMEGAVEKAEKLYSGCARLGFYTSVDRDDHEQLRAALKKWREG